jgi:hypothetical protein
MGFAAKEQGTQRKIGKDSGLWLVIFAAGEFAG